MIAQQQGKVEQQLEWMDLTRENGKRGGRPQKDSSWCLWKSRPSAGELTRIQLGRLGERRRQASRPNETAAPTVAETILGEHQQQSIKNLSTVEKFLFSKKEAAYSLAISLRSLEYRIANGELNTRRIGSRVLIPREELRRFASGNHYNSIN